jgi:protein gp37
MITMSKHAQIYLDASPERADDLARDLRYLQSVTLSASIELGRLASKIESLAPAGWRGIVSEMRYLQGELMEAARAEGDN